MRLLAGSEVLDATGRPRTLEPRVHRLLQVLVLAEGEPRFEHQLWTGAGIASSDVRPALTALRKPLPDGAIPRGGRQTGYRILLHRRQVDLWWFQDRVREGRRLMATGQPADRPLAIACFWEAEATWAWSEACEAARPGNDDAVSLPLRKRLVECATERHEARRRWTELVVQTCDERDLIDLLGAAAASEAWRADVLGRCQQRCDREMCDRLLRRLTVGDEATGAALTAFGTTPPGAGGASATRALQRRPRHLLVIAAAIVVAVAAALWVRRPGPETGPEIVEFAVNRASDQVGCPPMQYYRLTWTADFNGESAVIAFVQIDADGRPVASLATDVRDEVGESWFCLVKGKGQNVRMGVAPSDGESASAFATGRPENYCPGHETTEPGC